MARTATPPQRPFVTRRSTLVFCAVFVVAQVAWIPIAESPGTEGPRAMLWAGMYAVSAVIGVLAWSAGIILAVRSRSTVWMIVSCIPPPIGAVLCALAAPQAARPAAR